MQETETLGEETKNWSRFGPAALRPISFVFLGRIFPGLISWSVASLMHDAQRGKTGLSSSPSPHPGGAFGGLLGLETGPEGLHLEGSPDSLRTLQSK